MAFLLWFDGAWQVVSALPIFQKLSGAKLSWRYILKSRLEKQAGSHREGILIRRMAAVGLGFGVRIFASQLHPVG